MWSRSSDDITSIPELFMTNYHEYLEKYGNQIKPKNFHESQNYLTTAPAYN